MLMVYKYDIPVPVDSFVLDLPKGAKVLSFQGQKTKGGLIGGVNPVLWALVNPSLPTEKRTFIIRGTGHNIDFEKKQLNFIGTELFEGGALVLHLFEVSNQNDETLGNGFDVDKM